MQLRFIPILTVSALCFRLAFCGRCGIMEHMSTKLTPDQLDLVRQWAAQGIDLNGIQKKLVADCGVHMTYMDVRFLLLDHGIEIATAAAPAAPAPAPAAASAAPEAPAEPAAPGKLQLLLDDLQIPGTLLSGKVVFPSGIRGSWQIDQMGRLAWSDISATPSPAELQDFQTELMQKLRGMM